MLTPKFVIATAPKLQNSALTEIKHVNVQDKYEGIWQPDMVLKYPMDSNAIVHDLDPDRLNLIEAYKRIGQAIYEQWRAGNVETIYDFACGHGLLGLLLAYRFHKLNVVCVDLEYRPAFDHYLEVARGLGAPLQNISYIECDFNNIVLALKAYVICIHACNEGTKDALETAQAANACYAAMPCCIREGIYLRINHVDDRIRYATVVGIIAGQFGAYKITAIDERITNRNLIVLGGPKPYKEVGR